MQVLVNLEIKFLLFAMTKYNGYNGELC